MANKKVVMILESKLEDCKVELDTIRASISMHRDIVMHDIKRESEIESTIFALKATIQVFK